MLFYSIMLSGQDTYYKLSCHNLNDEEVLKKWVNISNKPLNYRLDDLSSNQHTFSIEGTYDDVSGTLFSLLGFRHEIINDVIILAKHTEPMQQTLSWDISVYDDEGYTLPYTHVSINALGVLDVTSDQGTIIFDFPIADSDTIQFKYLGLADTYRTVSQIKDNNNRVYMRPAAEAISEVVIVGKVATHASTQLIDAKDIPQAGSVDQDGLTIAQSIPGISNPSESFQDLIIRGGTPGQVQFQWNGIRILQSSHFFGKVSAVNPYMIDKLEVSKDGYSASQSGTISGGINMRSSRKVDHLSSKIHLNSLYGNIGLSIPISPKLSAKLAIRQSLPDQLQSPLASDFIDQIFQFGKITDEEFLINAFNVEDQVSLETRVNFGDQQMSLRYQVSPKTFFNFDFIHLRNELTFDVLSDIDRLSQNDVLNQSNMGLRLSANHVWSSSFSTSVNASSSDYKYAYSEHTDTQLAIDVPRNQNNEVILENYSLTNKLSLNWLSTSFGYEHNRWDSEINFTDPNIDFNQQYNNQSLEHVLFLILNPQLSPAIQIDAGLRWASYNKSLGGRKLIEPRLHVRYIPIPHLRFHGHYGQYHQYLSRRNFFTPLQADNGFWFIADESAVDFLSFIDIIQSSQYGGGIDLSVGSLDLSMDLYGKNISNVWSSSFDLSLDENPFRVSDLYTHGIEIMAGLKRKSHDFLVNYEFSNETIRFDNIDQKSLNPFSQPHKLGLTYRYRSKILSATIQYNYAIGRPFSIAENLVEQDVNNNRPNSFIQFSGRLNGRIADYHRVDLSIKTLPLGKTCKHSFGFQINNLLNRRNIIKNQYFINIFASPQELSLLQKAGIPLSMNIFWEVNIN